ncbi:SH3 domain-containing protein [Ruegeria sp. HKCCA5426]|uniref:SH3 domain-containing protein n=1 Tax=Ruegeria sp. HKCCA5426 TaxID=2682985 RepID=UPI0020C3F79C|nr:SH3 domain-containing protein [Ruegeria sp. HKCCA5426]
MSRLVLVTFAALGWCFYVMSGGPDFEPRGLRTAQPERVAVAPEPVPLQHTRAEQLVTNVALRTPTVRVKPILAKEEIVEILPEPASLETFSGLSAFADQSANITLASLEDGITGLRQIAETQPEEVLEPSAYEEPQKDIREIWGTRVNMRDGPGTIYPVIGKASIGQKVEVLSDSGTGWLRLRVLPEQQVGWISASLVRKTAD